MHTMTRDPINSAAPAMTRDEVRAFDAFAINEIGVPGVVLMENAGRSCAEIIRERLKDAPSPKVCVFCGTGNNGGDGCVIARHLLNRSFGVSVVVCGDYDKIKGDARINLTILERMGQPIERLNLDDPDLSKKVAALTDSANMIVDALLGTGLRGQVSEQCSRLIESINDRHIPVFAVDIPSGLDCDTGEPLGPSIVAEQTVTFVAIKKGFTVSENARRYTGQVTVASIGVEPDIQRQRSD